MPGGGAGRAPVGFPAGCARTEEGHRKTAMPMVHDVMPGLRALVIGAGGGIGAAITDALAAAGADATVVDVDQVRAKAAADSTSQHGRTALPVVADIRDGADIERAVAEARDGLGGIDVPVTVAGGLMA